MTSSPEFSVSKPVGSAVRRYAGKQKNVGSIPRFGSPLSPEVVIYRHCLGDFATLPSQ